MSVCERVFGKLSNGDEVKIFTLKNQNEMTVELSEYSAAVVKLIVPDRNGDFSDVVCGYDNLSSYEFAGGSQGSIVGRWANRIANGRFTLDGKEYTLLINNGKNHLHGGKNNLSRRIWKSEIVDSGDEPKIRFSTFSPDMEEGYPGNLNVCVTYSLTKENALSIEYFATTDKKTVINLTNHSYFNLGGYASGDIYNHVLKLCADTYLETDEGMIPTGKKIKVKGTPFDFTSPKKIGKEIDAVYRDLLYAKGYDHCFNFIGGETKEPVLRGSLYCPDTGRKMELYTNQPCVHLYTANFMNDKKYPLKGGLPQRSRHAVCLETERMPDSMNHKGFTKCTLDSGETYNYTTIFKFSTEE